MKAVTEITLFNRVKNLTRKRSIRALFDSSLR